MALASLSREKAIRRIRRGLYDVPRVNASLGGELSPDLDEAARALARRFRWRIIPDGAWAANLLGLSTQVPARVIYLSDGPSRTVVVGRRTIQFKHARPQALAGTGSKAGLVIQALRHLGKKASNEKSALKLKQTLSDAEKRELLKATRRGVDWVYEFAGRVAEVRS